MKRFILVSLLSCVVSVQIYSQGLKDVGDFVYGASTPMITGGAFAGASWLAGKYFGYPSEAAAIGAIGAIALFESYSRNSGDDVVNMYRWALHSAYPAETERRVRTAMLGEKCAKLSIASVSLYYLINSLVSK